MLSRVAERVYWAARYLERVENTARLLNVYATLLYDLPDNAGISWYNLIVASGGEAIYNQRYQSHDERRIVTFLLSDEHNPSSVLCSLSAIRENIRTTRDVVPPESWELVNELSLFVTNNIKQGINRRNRQQFLDEVIKACQQINGLIAGTMSHDAAWHFMRIGRYIERADMTSRILESGVAMLPEIIQEDNVHVADVIWGSVLRSLDAYLPYRRTMKIAVAGPDAAEFLLCDELFPRTVAYCLFHMQTSAKLIPKSHSVTRHINALYKLVNADVDFNDGLKALPNHLNQVQLKVSELHAIIEAAWFQIDHDRVEATATASQLQA